MPRRKQKSSFLCECLADAYISLLDQSTDEKITINEICDMSGVSRNTYFRNFKSKSELLSYKLKIIFRNWSANNPIAGKERSFERIYSFINLIYNNRQFFQVLYANNYKFLFYGLFSKALHEGIINTEQSYESMSFVFSFMGIIDVWIEKGMIETPLELLDICKQIFKKPEIN